MAGLLADVYSFGDTLKRKARGLLADPVGTLQQFVGNENDRAGRFNELTAQATDERVNRIKSGGKMGPSEQKLAGLLADAYNPAGMVVWHGSPHRFTKFDSSKIGTGEGSQAYGHGLYVAESPAVARQYQEALAGGSIVQKNGAKIIPQIGHQTNALRVLKDNDYNFEAAIKQLQKPLSGAADGWGVFAAGADKHRADQLQFLEELKASGAKFDSPGSLYKVDLPDEHIAKMLDWDKPLSQQAPEVQKALQAKQVQDSIAKLKASGQLGDYSPAELQQLKGEDWYDMLRQASGDSNAAPSDFLRQQGIPGIRYLDGGSRGTGQGTSNFVVFPGNEDLLKILEINGKPVGGLLGN